MRVRRPMCRIIKGRDNMTVIANGEIFDCTKAVKGEDYIELFDGGECTAKFGGISDFTGYSIEGGSWHEPQATTQQQLDALLATVFPAEPQELPALKAYRAAESKALLAEFLEQHPLCYTDGKRYSVTAEKQSLLTSVLARYQIAVGAGQQPTLKWNATGEECTEWSFDNLAALALSIAAYVEPLVAHQQALEVAINACETAKEVKAIEISYEIKA